MKYSLHSFMQHFGIVDASLIKILNAYAIDTPKLLEQRNSIIYLTLKKTCFAYNIETLKRLKVAYNRIFRTLMGLQRRARMSENLIRRGLDPFKVVMRKLVWSFRTRIIQCNNVLLENIAGSMHFMHSKLTRKWNASVLNLRP